MTNGRNTRSDLTYAHSTVWPTATNTCMLRLTYRRTWHTPTDDSHPTLNQYDSDVRTDKIPTAAVNFTRLTHKERYSITTQPTPTDQPLTTNSYDPVTMNCCTLNDYLNHGGERGASSLTNDSETVVEAATKSHCHSNSKPTHHTLSVISTILGCSHACTC